MSPDILALIASYFLCSEAAEVRVLDRSETATCTALYMDMKLAFVPEVDLVEFNNLSVQDRARVNRQAYAGYLDWRSENPTLVQQMETEARSLLTPATN